MSEPARQAPTPESGIRAPASTAPLRDWLATMRTAVSEPQAVETRAAETVAAQPDAELRSSGWSPRLVSAAAKSAESADEDVAEIMAENMMLKARLRLEAERRDELQVILAQEIRELRAHIAEEVGKMDDLRIEMDDLRAERDLWRARCEALAAPLFQSQPR